MPWTMPHRVLQIVAGLIGLAAVSSFALGVITAPQRGGRLPGARTAGASGPAAVIDAPDATPLSDERIEGPPQPTPEEIEQAKLEADAKKAEAAKAKAAAEAADASSAGNSAAPPSLRPPPPPISGATDQSLGGPPAPDEPPH